MITRRRRKCMQMNSRKNPRMELVMSDFGITANQKKIMLSMSMIEELQWKVINEMINLF